MVTGYHGKVNKKNGSVGTLLTADNSFQKDRVEKKKKKKKNCVEMLNDLIGSMTMGWLVGLSFFFFSGSLIPLAKE